MSSLVTMCRAKLHGCVVTQTELHYEGSITIDMDLVDKAGMLPWEKVQVVNQNNGSRFETYIIPGERGSGEICLNGPAARLAEIGDVVLVIAYADMELESARNWTPTVVIVDQQNRVKQAN
jgi:aspartate 1-decarboxylase